MYIIVNPAFICCFDHFVAYNPLTFSSKPLILEYMHGLFDSFRPIWKKLRKFKIELTLLTVAFIIALITTVLILNENQSENNGGDDTTDTIYPTLSVSPSHIVVDMAGAIEKPGVYEASIGARLKDILIQAGGLSNDVHRDFFSRNFNLAKLMVDQEKVYIPSLDEIANGVFGEIQKNLDYTIPSQLNTSQTTINEKININTASSDELDTLPGIGKTTADKIIKNRPYSIIEELLTKKAVNKSVYQNIKDLISI